MYAFIRRLGIQAAGLALIAGASLSMASAPVAAANACDTDPTNVLVEFLGVGASNTILVLGGDGYYTGNVLVHVYCGLDGSPVTNAIVGMWTTVPGSAIYDPNTATWADATNSANPVSISVPTGDQQLTLRTSTPDLSGWRARVGADTVTVTQAFGQTVTGTGGYPTASAAIFAQTPELDSLSLFGVGAAGLVGYSLMRRRARSRRRYRSS